MSVDRALDLSSLRYMFAARLLIIQRHLQPELGADFVLWKRLSQALVDAEHALNPGSTIVFGDLKPPGATRRSPSIDARRRGVADRIQLATNCFEDRILAVTGAQSQPFRGVAIRTWPAELCGKFAEHRAEL